MHKKILLINPFGIGDVLFTTPIIHNLKDLFTGVKLGYLCNRRACPLLESNPFIDYLYVYERDEFEALRRSSFFAWINKWLALFRQIKKEQFDLALDFSLNTQFGFFAWICGIRDRVGYDFKKRGRFLTKKIKLSGYEGRHIVEYYCDILKYLGLEPKYSSPELYLAETDESWAEELLARISSKDTPLVAIVPAGGGSWGGDAYLKHWPAEDFAQLADKIIEKYKAAVIILADQSEKLVAGNVVNNMRRSAVNLAGKTTLGQLAAILSRMELVITNDGGPLHMAVALGRKTLSFFGPVDPKVYGPYPQDKSRHIALRGVLECSPCYQNFRYPACLRDRRCLEKISVDEALDSAEKLLSGRSSNG